MKEMIHEVIVIAMPIILGYIVWLLKQQKTEKIQEERRRKEQDEKNNLGLMLLLRIQLIEYHDKYMKRGTIPSYAYQNFIDLYNAYHTLGGNGMVDKMFTEINHLHLHKKKTEGGDSNESED